MALYESHTFTTANQFLQDLSAFLTLNGATVDFSGVYNTNYYRVHFHIGDAHFDFYSTSSILIYLYACTGYSSGSSPSAQPGATDIKNFTSAVGQPYVFVSVLNAIYIGAIYSGSYRWCGLGTIAEQQGGYTQGFFVTTMANNLFSAAMYSISGGAAQLYYNDSWTTYNSAYNALCGDVGQGGGISISKQPNDYNGAIHPFVISAYLTNSSDNTKYHPIGVFPGIFKGNGGDIYSVGEEIPNGDDTYIIYPRGADIIGDTNGDFFFKLGAMQ